MIYISYEDYTIMGYALVPEEDFNRWEMKAAHIVMKYTFNRITIDNITETNKYGIAELIDAIYKSDKATNAIINAAGGHVLSFSNQQYSESYESTIDITKSLMGQIQSIMGQYFAADQTYRGFCPNNMNTCCNHRRHYVTWEL